MAFVSNDRGSAPTRYRRDASSSSAVTPLDAILRRAGEGDARNLYRIGLRSGWGEVRVKLSQALGAFEREAIRPHVTGRFVDMLIASTRHPAMLSYLDNAQSIGPNSRAGQRRGRGLNENLAREIMELFCLGITDRKGRRNYTEGDVQTLARAFTRSNQAVMLVLAGFIGWPRSGPWPPSPAPE